MVAGGIVAWSVPVWNVVVNPYQVFDSKFSIGDRLSSSTTNERFLKVEYLINESLNKKKKVLDHDAFIIGSSIMGLVDPSLVNRLFPDRRFYNLAFLAAKPDEILATLQGLKRRGVTIKTVVYGLEPIAFTDIRSYGPAYWLHPEASKQSRQRFFFDFLFASSLSDGFSRVVSVISGKVSVRYDVEGTGRYYLERYDREIEKDRDEFIRKQFPINTKPIKAPPWINDRFQDFRELVQWLKDEKIEAIFYLNPLHPYLVNAYGTDRIGEFKRKLEDLSKLSGIRDCTDVLSGADVNQRFYDYKHFRPLEASVVIDCGIKTQIH